MKPETVRACGQPANSLGHRPADFCDSLGGFEICSQSDWHSWADLARDYIRLLEPYSEVSAVKEWLEKARTAVEDEPWGVDLWPTHATQALADLCSEGDCLYGEVRSSSSPPGPSHEKGAAARDEKDSKGQREAMYKAAAIGAGGVLLLVILGRSL